MAHAQKPDFLFRRNGRVHLNRRGRQFSRLLAVELCTSAVVMLDTPCSEVVWRVLAIHSIRQFPLPWVTVCHHISTGLYHDLGVREEIERGLRVGEGVKDVVLGEVKKGENGKSREGEHGIKCGKWGISTGRGMGLTRLKMEICGSEKKKIFVRDKGRKFINHPGGTVYVLWVNERFPWPESNQAILPVHMYWASTQSFPWWAGNCSRIWQRGFWCLELLCSGYGWYCVQPPPIWQVCLSWVCNHAPSAWFQWCVQTYTSSHSLEMLYGTGIFSCTSFFTVERKSEIFLGIRPTLQMCLFSILLIRHIRLPSLTNYR